MQGYVQDHQIQIKQNLVSEDKLKVNFELLQQEIHERLGKELQSVKDVLKPKIKKRLKIVDLENKIKDKLHIQEFHRHMERINNQMRMVEDQVEIKFPALQYQFNRDLGTKASITFVEESLEKKVEREEFDLILKRLDDIEETAK